MLINSKDQLGNHFQFAESPKRIVCLVPSITELLYDLGLEEQIVGITKFCVHPYHLKATKKVIGGTKKVHYEKIKLLSPDIIIANKEENTIEIVEQLSKVAPVWVSNIVTIEDCLALIFNFGILFNKRTEAQKWCDKIAFAQNDFQDFIKAKYHNKPPFRVAYFIWANPYMVAGQNTFIDYLLTLNHFQNSYANREERYPEVIIQKMKIQGNPELILLSSEPFPFKDEHAFELGRYTHHAKTIFVNGEYFSWYGSRLVKAFQYFKHLHNNL